ncbi:hypothetical protein [Planctobacterium marinum]|uniref:hypothetical protein n=1 Tax=Planctobacterium marinum TaxID=1631968 RepID=UPI001E38B215|nr:hypothetical protein [Planctobacterium marinum]MCC2607895.1 hypothetical protein [Planctobacterium marinum]
MKTIVIAILILMGIFFVFGELSEHWFIFHLDGAYIVDPFINAIVFCVVAGALILMGFLLAVSLIGALILGLGAALFGVFFIGLSLFWPVLFIALILYLVAGGGKQAAS